MHLLSISLTPCIALALALTACNSSSRTSPSDPTVSRIGFTLEPSTRDLVAGETVTIFARSYDTYGRDPEITWSASSGKVVTEQNGRLARVQFDQPGTHTVTAVLTAEGQEIKRETVSIRVRPLS